MQGSKDQLLVTTNTSAALHFFAHEDCGAGAGFLSIPSDRQIKPCSFHQWTIPFETLDDVRVHWQQTHAVRQAAATGGCARLPHRALTAEGAVDAALLADLARAW